MAAQAEEKVEREVAIGGGKPLDTGGTDAPTYARRRSSQPPMRL